MPELGGPTIIFKFSNLSCLDLLLHYLGLSGAWSGSYMEMSGQGLSKDVESGILMRYVELPREGHVNCDGHEPWYIFSLAPALC